VATKHAADTNYLRNVNIADVNDATLVLRVPEGGSFVYEQLEDPQRKQRLSRAASDVLGTEVTVQFATPEAQAPVRQAKTADQRPSAPARPTREQRLKQEAQDDPAVRLLLRQFNGQIMNIDASHD